MSGITIAGIGRHVFWEPKSATIAVVSQANHSPIYWSFSGPDSWRLSVNQKSSAFSADPELIEALQKRAKPAPMGPDRVLFRQGDPPTGVFILRKGNATLTSQSDGDAVLSVQAGPGSLLGLPAVVGGKPYTLTAQAAEGAEFDMVPCEEFVELMRTEAQLSFRVLQILAAEIRFAREALSHL